MNILSFTVVVALSGVMSYASPGVFERVAANRAAGLTAHDIAENWTDYDILIATEDCIIVSVVEEIIGRFYGYKNFND